MQQVKYILLFWSQNLKLSPEAWAEWDYQTDSCHSWNDFVVKSIMDRLMSLVRDLFFLSVHLQFEFEDKIAHHTEEDKEAKQDQDVDPIDLEDLNL